ncbi:F0F1 ATP synthase subunit A [Bacillota bacterium]
MHSTDHLGPRIIASIFDGKIMITETVFFAMIVAVVMIIFALVSTRKLKRDPKGIQLVAELIVDLIYKMTATIIPKKNVDGYAPYIGTLFIFTILANATGLFGFRPVTADVNTAFALSTVTFFVIAGSSIHTHGFMGWVKHYGDPYPFMAPIMIIKDISLPVSLAFRLFGNITGGMIIMAFTFKALHAATDAINFHIPIFTYMIPLPLNLFFDVFEPLLQAFIFTTLTMAFVSMQLVVHEEH